MEEEISLEELFSILKKKSKIIIILTFLGIILAGVYTFFFVTPMYESSSRLVVNQTQNTNQTITNTDIQTNLSLINTYQGIIKEPIILEEVLSEDNLELTIQELSEKISVQTEPNSLVFGISVQDSNPYLSAELANSTARSFQKKIGDILEVESVTILSEATPNLSSVSPNITVNLLIGVVLGFVLGFGVAFLSEVMDKRVKDNRIVEDLGWTNLGSVLEMTTTEIKETRIDKKVRNTKPTTLLSKRRV